MEQMPFWTHRIKGYASYEAEGLEDFLENRNNVKHRRNGILVIVPEVTLECIPKKEDISNYKDIINLNELENELDDTPIYSYKLGKIYSGTGNHSINVSFSDHFLITYVMHRMVDFNNGDAITRRSVPMAFLHYKKEKLPQVIGVHEHNYTRRKKSLSEKIQDLLPKGGLLPQPALI